MNGNTTIPTQRRPDDVAADIERQNFEVLSRIVGELYRLRARLDDGACPDCGTELNEARR